MVQPMPIVKSGKTGLQQQVRRGSELHVEEDAVKFPPIKGASQTNINQMVKPKSMVPTNMLGSNN